jgi:hypothetical protein
MRAPDELLDVWTQLRGAAPGARAMVLSGCGDEPVGERDARLLTLHGAQFGSRLDGVATCPECGEQCEVAPDVDELRFAAEPPAGPVPVAVGDCRALVRAVTAADVAAAGAAGGVAAARLVLLERCVLEASCAGEPVAARALPAALVDAIERRLEALDPRAETLLELICPACGACWEADLDAGAFVWAALDVAARRLLVEVDALARTYGWSEREILALGSARRQVYLEFAAA